MKRPPWYRAAFLIRRLAILQFGAAGRDLILKFYFILDEFPFPRLSPGSPGPS
jgi:hypothetical protein